MQHTQEGLKFVAGKFMVTLLSVQGCQCTMDVIVIGANVRTSHGVCLDIPECGPLL